MRKLSSTSYPLPLTTIDINAPRDNEIEVNNAIMPKIGFEDAPEPPPLKIVVVVVTVVVVVVVIVRVMVVVLVTVSV